MQTKSTTKDLANELFEKQLAAERERRDLLLVAAKTLGERRDDLILKWHLSLAVGNGAGGIGLTSAILNTWSKPELRLPFVIGLWCFTAGILAAGLIPLLRAWRIDQERRQKLISAHSFQHGDKSYVYTGEDEMEESDTVWYRHQKIGRYWLRGAIAAQIASASLFAAGLLIPLTWLTVKIM